MVRGTPLTAQELSAFMVEVSSHRETVNGQSVLYYSLPSISNVFPAVAMERFADTVRNCL